MSTTVHIAAQTAVLVWQVFVLTCPNTLLQLPLLFQVSPKYTKGHQLTTSVFVFLSYVYFSKINGCMHMERKTI